MERPAGDGLIAIINPATDQRTFRPMRAHELDPSDPHYAPAEEARFNEALLLEGDNAMIELADSYWPNGDYCKPSEATRADSSNVIELAPVQQRRQRIAPTLGQVVGK